MGETPDPLFLAIRTGDTMARRMRNRFELRAEAEALERLGVEQPKERKPRAEPAERRPRPSEAPRMRVVWAVCDIGGRTIATFDYTDKPAAEARAAELKARGKGEHFVRQLKEPMNA
jgi:hypothetical protein